MEFSTADLGLEQGLQVPLMNGGGCIKTVGQVKEAAKSLIGAIVVGSFTVFERDGNPGDVWWCEDGVGLNSLGMPNGGIPYLKLHQKEMVKIAHDAGKELVVNVAGFSPQEYKQLSECACENDADVLELNLGCPNVVIGSGRKPIACFNVEVTEEILTQVSQVAKPVWVKVSPYSDPEMLQKIAEVICKYKYVKAITVANTFPSAYGMNDAGKHRISVGLAGLSGRPLEHISLGQVLQWKFFFSEHLVTTDVIAAGGISSGKHLKNYYLAGARAFQLTTELLKHGTLDFHPLEKIVREFDEL